MLGKFFGVGEADMEKFDGDKLGRIHVKRFTKGLTDEDKEKWMDKAKGVTGKQVKITQIEF